VSADLLLAWTCAAGVFLLICEYAIGAPLVLLRTLVTAGHRRRRRYRPGHDDGLATSRFTIPVSIVLPVARDDDDAVTAARGLLELRYPELELIVVTSAAATDSLERLRNAFALRPCELFYRRLLSTSPVAGIYRSVSEPRLLVAVIEGESVGDARNCGTNLARFRYVCFATAAARYKRAALLESMQAALEDPSRVVGVTAALAVKPEGGDHTEATGRLGVWDALRHAAGARRRLTALGRRRVDLPPEGATGFSIWRRDVLLDVGGFAAAGMGTDADMTFRVHRQFRGDRQRYRVLHLSDPAGTVPPSHAGAASDSARATAALVWRHGLLLNPAYGRLGLLDLPRFALNAFVAPWVEALALVLLLLAVPAGVLTAGQMLLVLFGVGLGNGVLVATALLLDAEAVASLHPSALLNLALVGPFEYFLARPARLR